MFALRECSRVSIKYTRAAQLENKSKERVNSLLRIFKYFKYGVLCYIFWACLKF